MGESLVPLGGGVRARVRRTPVGIAGRGPVQPAEASSAVFFERPVILRPSQATGS